MSGRLTDGFRDIIDLRWSDFVEIEQNLTATNFDAVVCSVVRACVKGNLRAIQTALDRLDGKIAAEVEVEYPKFYYIYPNATKTADDPNIIDIQINEDVKKLQSGSTVKADPVVVEEELPTGSLRAVLEKMLDSPRAVVTDILEASSNVDKGILTTGNPLVKSVVVAGLMKLVHDGRMNAVFEVFEQIDGKVADKIKLLGNDFYIKRFDLIAPAGAVKNADGIYQIANDITTDSWVAKLKQSNHRGER